ncbi:MAG: putative homoserine kinase type (protein kinase fold) [Acidimicrobiaceae bacterium]|nr:putative homoserine kinase type (protein kinase fold) [Acidimicrobiaceae bacterium]
MTTYPYSSTHRLEVVSAGRLRKDLSESARMTHVSPRPDVLADPTREPAAYRHVLGPLGIGPRLWDSGHDWVTLEHLDAPELWQIGNVEVWVAVAAWVARMHTTLARQRERCRRVPLLTYDAKLFGLWRDRAAANGLNSSVVDAHRRASARLLGLPRTVLHGDLYASNLLVEPTQPTQGAQVWPIDWELMGVGPAVVDLAALTAGSWSEDARWRMARAYFDTARYPRSESQRRGDLCAARLHLCVQWIGAAAEWTSPAVHRHDWLAEADEMAAAL